MTNSSLNSQAFFQETGLNQPRLKVVTLTKDTTEKFLNVVKKFNVQAIEYKPFLGTR